MNIFFLSHGETYTADTGGRIRTYEINRALSKKNRVFQLSVNPFRTSGKLRIRPFKVTVSENYQELVFNSLTLASYAKVSGIFNFPQELYLGRVAGFHKFPATNELGDSQVLMTSSPWLMRWAVSSMKVRKPIVYTPADLTYEFYRQKPGIKQGWLQKIREMESYAVSNSDIILAVSEEEKKKFNELYGFDLNRIFVIPNGVDVARFKNVQSNKKENRRKLGLLDDKNIALFVGGNHYPSVQATEFIERLSDKLPQVLFFVVGGVGEPSKSHDNVIYTGRVDDVLPYFSIADIAVNPITSGTGSNIKLAEYLAAGIPCISTTYGIRGTDLKPNKELLIADDEASFLKSISKVLNNPSLGKRIALNGRMAAQRYDWSKIALRVDSILKKLLKIT